MDLENLKEYSIPPDLNVCNVFGTPEEFAKIPQVHKDQMIFLNKNASDFVKDFFYSSGIINNSLFSQDFQPFQINYFKTIEKEDHIYDDQLKKWLYHRGIQFKANVFIIADSIILTTWKMVVKYAPSIFFAEDIFVFDETLNWCLFYFHEGEIYFGKDRIYNPEIGYQKTLETWKMLNDMRAKYPNINFPDLV